MLKILLVLWKYLPDLLNVIMRVERTLEGHAGATKKAAVLAAVQVAAHAAGESVDEHVKAIGQLVDSLVATLNKFGWGK